jgi:hypothetical protein
MESSGLNPPIPAIKDVEAATGAIYTSTAKDRLDVPTIGGPRPSTKEGHRHACVKSDDALGYVREQFIPLANVTWSTTQSPGTILWSTPVTPLRGNIIMSYLAGIFNCWAGGLDFQMKVAGTAFHAGSIGIGRLPPNINPSKFKNTSQLGTFEYNVIDPKQLEAVSKDMPDQRNIMFHYMDDDLTKTENIAGYITIYVIQQLVTSSTGVNQIDIEVFNKGANDFDMFQIKPPNLTSVVPTDVEKWAILFQFPELNYSPILTAPMLTLQFHPQAFTTTARTGQTSLSGIPIGSRSYIKSNTNPFDNSISSYQFFASSSTNLVPVNESGEFYPRNLRFTQSSAGTFASAGSGSNLVTPLVVDLSSTFNTVTGAIGGSYYRLNPNITATLAVTFPGETVLRPPPGESLVTFGIPSIAGWNTTTPMVTTTFLECMFGSGRFSIGENEAVILNLIDNVTGLPFGFLKLYHDGYFTTNVRTTLATYSLINLSVVFNQFISKNAPIPTPTQTMLMTKQHIEMRSMIRTASNFRIAEHQD